MAGIIKAFLEAENERDWETYGQFLASDVEWTVYGPPEARVVRGRESYLDAIRQAYAGDPRTFTITALAVDESEGVALVEFNLEGRRSVCVFEVADGLIWREREYFDDRLWREVREKT